MTDHIKREDARGKLCSMCRWEGTDNCGECENPIDDIPAADVRPVVHAHWEIANRTYENSPSAPWICSECKKHGGNYRWYGSKPTWIRFCETCGAVMDEEAQDGS